MESLLSMFFIDFLLIVFNISVFNLEPVDAFCGFYSDCWRVYHINSDAVLRHICCHGHL